MKSSSKPASGTSGTSSKPTFRKEALDYLHSPDELAQFIQIVSKKSWITLWTLYGMIACLLIWGFLGSIPIRIEGKGFLLNEDAVLFLPPSDGKRVQNNMTALVALNHFGDEAYENLRGKVVDISNIAFTQASLNQLYPNNAGIDNYIKEFGENGLKTAIRIRFENENLKNDNQITPGMPIDAKITVGMMRPIHLIIPSFKKMFQVN